MGLREAGGPAPRRRNPAPGKAAPSLIALKASGPTEGQATALWHFVGDLLCDHAEVVRLGCIRAIRELGGITGRD